MRYPKGTRGFPLAHYYLPRRSCESTRTVYTRDLICCLSISVAVVPDHSHMFFRGDLVQCPALGQLDILPDYLLGTDNFLSLNYRVDSWRRGG
jgi:hypothetical protein